MLTGNMNVITERYKVRTCRQLVVISMVPILVHDQRLRVVVVDVVVASLWTRRQLQVVINQLLSPVSAAYVNQRTLLRRPLPLLRLNKAMSGSVGVCL